MSSATIERIAKTNTDALAGSGHVAEQIAKSNAEIFTGGSSAALAGVQELTKAYQSLATRNAEKMTASIKALAAVKTPVEFLELQRKLITEGVDAAVSDCGNIAKLTAAVFTAAFEPVQKQVEVLQNTLKR